MRSLVSGSKLNTNPGLLLLLGIVLLVLGILAISVSVFTTLVSVVFLGILLIVGSIIVIIDTFKTRKQDKTHFILYLIFSLLYLAAGILLVRNPVWGAVSITFILAVFYIMLGIFRIIGTIALRLPQYGWSLLSGLLALILGILILIHWPASSLIVIGLFLGIDLLFLGWTYIALALSAKNKNQQVAR